MIIANMPVMITWRAQSSPWNSRFAWVSPPLCLVKVYRLHFLSYWFVFLSVKLVRALSGFKLMTLDLQPVAFPIVFLLFFAKLLAFHNWPRRSRSYTSVHCCAMTCAIWLLAVSISLASVSTCLCPSKNLICNLDYVLSCTLHCTLLRE